MTDNTQIQQNKRENLNLISIFLVSSLLLLIASLYQKFVSGIDFNSMIIITIGVMFLLSIISFLSKQNNGLLALYIIVFQFLILAKIISENSNNNTLLSISSFLVSILLLTYLLPKRRLLFWVTSILLFGMSFFYASTSNIINLAGDSSLTMFLFVMISIYLLYGFVIHISRINNYSITVKIILGTIFSTIIPILIVMLFINNQNQSIIITQNQQVLITEGSLAAQQINQYIESNLIAIETEANIPAFRNFLLAPSETTEPIAKATLQSLSAKSPGIILSYGILNPEGVVVLDSVFSYEGQDESESVYFKESFQNELTFVSDVVFPNKPNEEISIYFSAPIRSPFGVLLGVLRIRINADFIQKTMAEHEKTSRNTGYAALYQELPNNYIEIGDSQHNDMLYTTLIEPSAPDRKSLQINEQIPLETRSGLISINENELFLNLKTITNENPFFEQFLVSDQENFQAYVTPITSHPSWTMVQFESQETFDAIVAQQTQTTQYYIFVITVVVSLTAFGMGQLFTRPIIRLTNTVIEAQKGNLKVRAEISSDDEVGVLANAVNYFISELERSIENFEFIIGERTEALETQVNSLRTAAEIGQISSSSVNLNEILNAIVFKVSEAYDFYHVGIFLLDDSGEFAVLQATNSEGGWKMLARNHKLLVGKQGVVGNAIATGNERIVQENIEKDAAHFVNPDLPNTRSELALPLIMNNVVLGALDVQSERDNAFSDTDISVLKVLANQIALSINNIRLLSELQGRIDAERRAFGVLTADSWKKETELREVLGYRSTSSGTYPLVVDDVSKNMIGILEKISSSNDEKIFFSNDNNTLSIPIKVREQVIGYLEIDKEDFENSNDVRWSQAELDVISTITEQLGYTLDNARLLEESRRTSIRERITTDISRKIWASSDIESILQTTLEEIGKALNISQGSIQIDLSNPETLDENEMMKG